MGRKSNVQTSLHTLAVATGVEDGTAEEMEVDGCGGGVGPGAMGVRLVALEAGGDGLCSTHKPRASFIL